VAQNLDDVAGRPYITVGRNEMSTNLVCFLFGIPATLFWLRGVKKGIMLGRLTGWVRRDIEPATFWFATAFYGSVALGFLIGPILSWLGIRD
jgi:hypothetical protein